MLVVKKMYGAKKGQPQQVERGRVPIQNEKQLRKLFPRIMAKDKADATA